MLGGARKERGYGNRAFRSVLRQFRDEVMVLRASLDHPTRSAVSAVALTFASRRNTVRFSLASRAVVLVLLAERPRQNLDGYSQNRQAPLSICQACRADPDPPSQ